MSWVAVLESSATYGSGAAIAQWPVGEGLQSGAPAVRAISVEGDDIGGVALLFLIGLYLVYDGFRTWQRMRLMQDTPTEKVRSAAVGRTELTGTGTPLGEPMGRPFGDGECLLATYEIEEWEEDHDDQGPDGHWETVETGALVAPFQLDDGTGTMRVAPDEQATIKIAEEHTRRIRVRPSEEEPPAVREFLRTHADEDIPPSDGMTGLLFSEDRRYTERWIPIGTDLYLLGATESVSPTETNSSGLVLERDGATDEFIISELSEEELVDRAQWKAPLEIIGGIALSALMLYILLPSLGLV